MWWAVGEVLHSQYWCQAIISDGFSDFARFEDQMIVAADTRVIRNDIAHSPMILMKWKNFFPGWGIKVFS